MAPAAPGLFSTSTCCPHMSLSFAAKTRAIRSELRPGGYATISFTGRAGYCCASAVVQTNARRQRSRVMSAFDAHFLDDRAELLDLALQYRVLLRRARADRLGADGAQALRGLRMVHRGPRCPLQPLDHLARRVRPREQPVPALGFEVGEAPLARRGQVRPGVASALRGACH